MNRFILYFASVFYFFFSGCSQSSKQTGDTLFKKLSSGQTGITFINANTEDVKGNILAYEYFYNGGGVALGDINNDGLTDIYFSANQGENKLYLNKGNFTFDDITEKAGVVASSGWKTGVTMVDINHDGYLDIYLCRSGDQHPLFRQNSFFINNGDLTFTDKATALGLNDDSYSTQAAFLDFDRDGDLDMFLLNHSRLAISNSYDIKRRYINERVRYVGNKFYRNDNGKFRDVSDSVGVYGPASNYGLGIACSDLNNDGWMDIYTSNDYTEKDKILINKKGKVFHEASDSLLTHMSQFSMGTDIADVNNDGLYDILSLDMLPESNKRQKEFYWPDRYDVYQSMVKNGLHHQYMRNMLQMNNGDGTFSEIGQLAAISNTDWSWAALIEDYDNDGLQDIFITNGFKRNFTSNDFLSFRADLAIKAKQGEDVAELNDILNKMPSNKVHNYIFKNLTGISFSDVSSEWGFNEETLSNGAAFGDLDNDGDLDLVVNNMDEVAGMYRNNGGQLNKNNYLKVNLEGDNKNTAGIGAVVTLFAEGTLMKKMLSPTRGFQSSVEPLFFFGLGKIDEIDSLILEWPTGEVQRLDHVKTNQMLTLRQKNAQHGLRKPQLKTGNLFSGKEVLDFKHNENDFIDFKVQALLPRMYSTTGPALATADVNKDGLPDIFVGGAQGQASAILIQEKRGAFRKIIQPLFESVAGSEIVDAVFFDKDGDEDEDLYLVTGGYEFSTSDPLLLDHLYENDGRGHFKTTKLPEFYSSGSCVRPADIDADGDIDLFVGGRIIPGKYPETPESHILLNDGKGSFSIVTEGVSNSLKKIGLVSDALWLDINKDDQPDLIVVGEWMGVRILINEKGKLSDKTTQYIKEKTEGWWNCILAEDFDNDGDADLVIGNFGLNNQFKPGEERPVTLYANDYDNNGSIDPLINYFIGQNSFPSPTRDELVNQLPSFKKRFLQYNLYADAVIETILTPGEMTASEHLIANHFETMYFQNNGNSFTGRAMPAQLQVSPVFALCALDIDADGNLDLVTGGNLSKMPSRFGNATGNFGSVFLGDGKGNFHYVPQRESGISVRGEVRKILMLNDKKILFSVNNSNPIIYKLKE